LLKEKYLILINIILIIITLVLPTYIMLFYLGDYYSWYVGFTFYPHSGLIYNEDFYFRILVSRFLMITVIILSIYVIIEFFRKDKKIRELGAYLHLGIGILLVLLTLTELVIFLVPFEIEDIIIIPLGFIINLFPSLLEIIIGSRKFIQLSNERHMNE